MWGIRCHVSLYISSTFLPNIVSRGRKQHLATECFRIEIRPVQSEGWLANKRIWSSSRRDRSMTNVWGTRWILYCFHRWRCIKPVFDSSSTQLSSSAVHRSTHRWYFRHWHVGGSAAEFTSIFIGFKSSNMQISRAPSTCQEVDGVVKEDITALDCFLRSFCEIVFKIQIEEEN